MSFYIDGVEQGLTDAEKNNLSVAKGISRMILGAGPWVDFEYLVGGIDEVSIYNTSLNSEQIMLLKQEVQP